jgi:hypothetical protein
MSDQVDPNDPDPDIEVPEGTVVDVPAEVVAEFQQELDAYEQELRQELGKQFAGYEDIDHPDDDSEDDIDHPGDDIDHPDDSQ